MKNHLLVAAFFVFISVPVSAQFEFQDSHIEANVPPPESFDSFLTRDLLAYFKATGTPGTTAVTYKLLRNGPTQSGVSYPKYYLWVKVLTGPKLSQEGAVRVAAIERTHFDVTNFISKTQIQAAPAEVGNIFPATLVPSVLSRAGVK